MLNIFNTRAKLDFIMTTAVNKLVYKLQTKYYIYYIEYKPYPV